MFALPVGWFVFRQHLWSPFSLALLCHLFLSLSDVLYHSMTTPLSVDSFLYSFLCFLFKHTG